MSAIKDAGVTVMLADGNEYRLLFTLNALDELQDKYGDLSAFGDKLSGAESIKAIRWILTLLINDGAPDGSPELTERQVGRLVDASEIASVTNAVFRAINKGQTGTDTPPDGDAGKKTATKKAQKPI